MFEKLGQLARKTDNGEKVLDCIICDKPFTILFFDPELDEDSLEECWSQCDANTFKIEDGYGSKFDLMKFRFCICDECLEKIIKKQGLNLPDYV